MSTLFSADIPERLYKYQSFSNRALDVLIGDKVNFADPSKFNDPLDTRPSLETDINVDDLADLYRRLVSLRVQAEMNAAAQTIKYTGPKTWSHIAAHSQKRAATMLAEIRDLASDPDFEVDSPEPFLFARYIEDELLRRYDKGIMALAERADCPLMWSHYGDQHNGLCIGYSVPANAASDLLKVSYGGSRRVTASRVVAMLNGAEGASHEVDNAILARKASEWRYEREWRLIGPRYLQQSPLDLEEVVFGMRCSWAVKVAIVNAVSRKSRKVKFFDIQEQYGEFDLNRCEMDSEELLENLPPQARDVFDVVPDI